MLLRPLHRYYVIVFMAITAIVTIFGLFIIFAINPFFMNRQGYVWFPYKMRFDHKFLFILAGLGFLVGAGLSLFFLLKMKTKIYHVQLVLDFSSKWLSKKISLLVLTIVLIVGIKLLTLEAMVKVIEIIQAGEPIKDPDTCKNSFSKENFY